MTTPEDSTPRTDRWRALLVRYWAFNMGLIHDSGTDWPGFGYTDDEKAKLAAIAATVPAFEFYAWVAASAVFFIALAAIIVVGGMACLAHAIGGEQNMASTPAALFFLQLAMDLVAALAIGFPLAMLPAAALAGRFFTVADAQLPDRDTTSFFFHKLWFQITRIAVIGALALVPLWIFVPADSKFWVTAQLVLPILSPAVAALTAVYFAGARRGRSA